MVDWVRPDDWTPAMWSHPAVMDMQARLDPARMTRYADDWHAAVDQIRDVLTELNRQVTAQLDEAWRGQGADSALTAVQQYVTGSLDGLAACRSAAAHLTELSRAAGDLRACLGAPYAPRKKHSSQVRRLYSAPAVAAGNAVADIPAPPDPLPIGGPAAVSVLPAGVPTTPGATTPGAAPLTDAPLASASHRPYDGAWRPDLSAADTQPLWRAPTSSAAVSPPGRRAAARAGRPACRDVDSATVRHARGCSRGITASVRPHHAVVVVRAVPRDAVSRAARTRRRHGTSGSAVPDLGRQYQRTRSASCLWWRHR